MDIKQLCATESGEIPYVGECIQGFTIALQLCNFVGEVFFRYVACFEILIQLVKTLEEA